MAETSPQGAPLCIRTVLDARNPSTKYMFQVLLLAASWHKSTRSTAPLEVLIIGDAPDAMLRFLESIGARCKAVAPDPNDQFSATSNTITGCFDTDGQRILLVDNDVVFRGDLSELSSVDSQLFMGSIAGTRRVLDAQWKAIEERFGFGPLPATKPWLKELVRVQVEPDKRPTPLGNVYVNGGVLLLPAGEEFGTKWRHYVREIAELFHNHPLRSGSVYGSNMAGLAMAIAAHANFEWLNERYNYRCDCFALGLEQPERIEIVHLTGLADSHRSVCKRVEDYWQKKMLARFNEVQAALSEVEKQKRLTVIENFRCELLSLIDEYELEQWARQFPVGSVHLYGAALRRNLSRPLRIAYNKVRQAAADFKRCVVTSKSDCNIELPS